MKDQILTPHFKLSEFINSPTAKARNIDNTPSVQVINSLRALCVHVLEPLREHVNEVTPHKQGEQVGVFIGSGYRCPALNKAVGGMKNSQHMKGEAADIHIPDEQTGREWFLWIMDNLQFDQLIWEKNTSKSKNHWIHVSYREGHCRQHVIRNLTKKSTVNCQPSTVK